MEKTALIYLIGKPGTGKYTISQELAHFGYVVCDNQLINNPIFALLNYDGFMQVPSYAWKAIEKIRNGVFDFIAQEPDHSYVLTNVLFEDEGDQRLFSQVEQLALKRSSLFVPVKLVLSEEENIKRITEPTRTSRWKSIDPNDVYSENPLINISHPNLLELDVTTLTATEAAERILEHVNKRKTN